MKSNRNTRAAVAIMLTVAVCAFLAPATSTAAGGSFVDRAVASGVGYPSTPSWDVCTGDINNDGVEDFHTSLHMKNVGALFANNNDGTFARVAMNVVSPKPTPGFGTKAFVDRHACVIADFDKNGLADLYSTAGRYASNRVKEEGINNELFLQTSPSVFTDAATSMGVGEICSRGRHVIAPDLNSDGWPDLFVAAQKERFDSGDPCNSFSDYPSNEQSKVFINRGNGSNGEWQGFRYAPEFSVRQDNTGSRAAVEWDYNQDGNPDVMTLTFANKTPFFYRNNGGNFTEVGASKIVPLPLMNGMKVGDITGDGIEDLVFADNSGFGYRAGTATGVSTTTVRLGTVSSSADGWSVALGDANGDGLMDVYGLTASASGDGNPDDIVYLANVGGGFTPNVVPSAYGDANDVEAVLVRGRAQFVVLNGGNNEKEAPGPVQIIAYQE